MKRLVALVALLVASTSYAENLPCVHLEPPRLSADAFHWKLIKSTRLPRKTHAGVLVSLWRSKEVAACSGGGDPMYTVKLIVESRGKMLYRFEPDQDVGQLWLGRVFEVRNVMGLGTPQVLLQTGTEGVSDQLAHLHIIPISGRRKFTDTGISEMDSSWRRSLGWFASHGRAYAVVAVPIIRDDPESGEVCHFCPHHYRYIAYTWDAHRSKWVVAMAVAATRTFDANVDPLAADHGFIQRRLL